MLDSVAGCKSCEQFNGKTRLQIGKGVELIASGSTKIKGKVYRWVVIPSGKSSVIDGQHLVFTTISHHVGSEEMEVRAALTAKATKVAGRLLGSDFRLVVNFGGASSRDHFHVHLIQPGEGEVLPRIIANIPEVISRVQQEKNISPEAVKALLAGIMQKKE